MSKKILIVSGSPKKNGNTAALVQWFCEGATGAGNEITVVQASRLESMVTGCQSCRACQKNKEYGCVFKDGVADVLLCMNESDAIVMATPLYFFSMSTQVKAVMDRMFSLYKWDNIAGTMETKLNGKMLVLLASAYEDIGLSELEAPFKLTAGYSKMKFMSLVVPNAGESGDIVKLAGIREKAIALGKVVGKIR
jgi:multimeric flavodoxin WrbA